MFAKIGRTILLWIVGVCAALQFGYIALAHHIAARPDLGPSVERWGEP
jgi:hypothetical protein